MIHLILAIGKLLVGIFNMSDCDVSRMDDIMSQPDTRIKDIEEGILYIEKMSNAISDHRRERVKNRMPLSGREICHINIEIQETVLRIKNILKRGF